jgi:hypothetical protein
VLVARLAEVLSVRCWFSSDFLLKIGHFLIYQGKSFVFSSKKIHTYPTGKSGVSRVFLGWVGIGGRTLPSRTIYTCATGIFETHDVFVYGAQRLSKKFKF